MYEPGCKPVTRSENSQHLSSWGGYTFGHWPGAVHSERAEKVDVSHAVASQNGALWAIYAVEWMISSTAAASSCYSCSLCFWPSQIDSIDIPLTMRRQVFSRSFPAQAHVFVCFGPLRRWLRAFSPQGGARKTAHRTDIPINKRRQEAWRS